MISLKETFENLEKHYSNLINEAITNSGGVKKGSLLGLRKVNFNYSNKLSPPTILYNTQISTSNDFNVFMLSNSSTTIIKHK